MLTNLYGPVPIGRSRRSVPDPLGTTGMTRLMGKDPNGSLRVNRTVYGSTASTVFNDRYAPFRGDTKFGSMKELNVKTTSSAVSSCPSWNCTPCRSLTM